MPSLDQLRLERAAIEASFDRIGGAMQKVHAALPPGGAPHRDMRGVLTAFDLLRRMVLEEIQDVRITEAARIEGTMQKYGITWDEAERWRQLATRR